MTKVIGFVRSFPVVSLTLAIGTLVLALLGLGHSGPAQWIATGYVAVIILITSTDMVRDILRGHWGLDILAVIAMVATLAVGEYVASLIIVLMLSGGEALEVYAAGRARAELTSLLDRAPRRARRVGDGDRMEDIDVDEVVVGDILLVRPAEVVPVDGDLLDAEAVFDESSLTGESLPVERVRGDSLMSGSVNGQRAVQMRATATAADSQYQQILTLVAEAEDAKAPTVRVADRFAVPFTIVSLLIAGIAWWVSGDPVRFAEVLVLATPCPLLIAAPVAFMGGMSRSARSGVIVKGGATLESLARARTVAFDKTGTLSHGRPELAEVRPANGFDADEVLRLAASAEQFSSHVLAAGVIRAAQHRGLSLAAGVDASEVATHGVEARIGRHAVRVGKLGFVQEVDPAADFDDLEAGHTAVAVAVDGRFAGTLVLRDALRENAAATVRVLREAGIGHVAMLTGDNEATARSLAGAAGIDEVHASLLPQDKVRLVSELEPRVVMVGDGVNDAPVLAAADVGIAMGARGSTAASESADVVIMADDIGKVAQALEIGRDTYRVALTAIWIGVVLSIGLMVVAAFGHIPAVAGALTQELVDLATILYALRALRGRTSHPELALPRALPPGGAAWQDPAQRVGAASG
ncbi:heavy metal translocating P-type ATPase [Ornithinimicrobium cryptoxanthini]|uniref:Heavy metal translocating P-type ATPase n=1 Tax=Ornithinimicrobium cryptoxanthini TaxID=2934161 RepID=A0ABY4YHP2_9MICO|nr:heavy metal translocating P-type ATPase [Ornithinimicrobium cryptoxanthini]USQ76269.1 heavy metal translocating P-type ATPase [Ornithinimicrobium cryptoxanthini]